MTERSVSDLVFRDIEPDVPGARADEERREALHDELVKLRSIEPAPRVVPAAQAAGRRA